MRSGATRSFVRRGRVTVGENKSEKGGAKNQGKNTAGRVWDVCLPVAESLGLRLWDVRFEKEGALWYLRVFIDKEGGVTIGDCEAMSRAADAPIEALDPCSQSYFLEVCSPGVERELRRPEHFEHCAGQEVCVVLFHPIDGEKEIIAELAGLRDKEIILKDQDGREFSIPKKLAQKVRIVCDFPKSSI